MHTKIIKIIGIIYVVLGLVGISMGVYLTYGFVGRVHMFERVLGTQILNGIVGLVGLGFINGVVDFIGGVGLLKNKRWGIYIIGISILLNWYFYFVLANWSSVKLEQLIESIIYTLIFVYIVKQRKLFL